MTIPESFAPTGVSVLDEKNDVHIPKATAHVHCDACNVDTTFEYPADTAPGTQIKWEHGQSNEDPGLCDLHQRDAEGVIVEDASGFGIPKAPFVGVFTVPTPS